MLEYWASATKIPVSHSGEMVRHTASSRRDPKLNSRESCDGAERQTARNGAAGSYFGNCFRVAHANDPRDRPRDGPQENRVSAQDHVRAHAREETRVAGISARFTVGKHRTSTASPGPGSLEQKTAGRQRRRHYR